MRRRDWFLINVAGAAALQAEPQPSATPARRHSPQERLDLFQRYLAQRGEALTASQFEGIHSREDWERRRPAVLRKFLDTLGLDPLPPRTPLRAEVTGRLTRSGYAVENVVFQSMPGLYVTGNLYLPETSTPGGKAPTVLYVCGHSPGPAGAKVSYQHHGIWFARNGFLAFVIDTLEFGEIPGIHHGTHNLQMWDWLSLGYTPAAVEVWNAIRALDYLETRAEADMTRVAMTGRSGGGPVTWYTAAVDDRIHVAAPVHGTWAVGPHVRDRVVRENCDCIYFWNIHRLDLPTVGALIAPRPLKFINARQDVCFPPAGYEEVHRQLRDVYEWYKVPDRLATFAADTGHMDNPDYRREANLWIAKWLLRERPDYSEAGITPEKDVDLLRALKHRPPGARNESIQRTFIPAGRMEEYTSKEGWETRRTRLLALLQERCLSAWPTQPGPYEVHKQPDAGWLSRYAQAWNVEFSTEPGIRVQARLLVPRDAPAAPPALIYVKGANDLVDPTDHDDILSALATHVVLVLRPRAVDYSLTNEQLAGIKVSAALLGTTLESMQLWDILRALEYLAGHERLAARTVSLYGRGEMGALALCAAALRDNISRVIVNNPPVSFWNGPAVLHALRYTDLPEIARVIAPREIVSIGPIADLYRAAGSLYRLYGAPGLREAGSLGEALKI